jgi:hypothetical protein
VARRIQGTVKSHQVELSDSTLRGTTKRSKVKPLRLCKPLDVTVMVSWQLYTFSTIPLCLLIFMCSKVCIICRAWEQYGGMGMTENWKILKGMLMSLNRPRWKQMQHMMQKTVCFQRRSDGTDILSSRLLFLLLLLLLLLL